MSQSRVTLAAKLRTLPASVTRNDTVEPASVVPRHLPASGFSGFPEASDPAGVAIVKPTHTSAARANHAVQLFGVLSLTGSGSYFFLFFLHFWRGLATVAAALVFCAENARRPSNRPRHAARPEPVRLTEREIVVSEIVGSSCE